MLMMFQVKNIDIITTIDRIIVDENHPIKAPKAEKILTRNTLSVSHAPKDIMYKMI